MNLPQIETLVYLGSTSTEEEDGTSARQFMFQTVQSYQQDGDSSGLPAARRTELAARADVMFYDESSVGMIADIDGLLVLLGGLRERMRRGLGWDSYLPDGT